METIKKLFKKLTPSPLKLTIAFIWFTIFLLLGDKTGLEILYWISYPGLIYMVAYVIIFSFYGMLLNPIRDRKMMRKQREEHLREIRREKMNNGTND